MTRYGNDFELSAIQDWFNAGHNFCPITGKPLKPSGLVTNKKLMQKIQTWKEETGYESEHTSSEEDIEDESFFFGSLVDQWESPTTLCLPIHFFDQSKQFPD